MERAPQIIPERESDLNERQKSKSRASYWEHLLSQYEKRNAKLEQRQAALVERVKFMECALPSLLMSAVINSTKECPQKRPSSNTAADRYQKVAGEECKVDE